MHAILLTVFVSLVLVLFFVVLFLRERTSGDSISSAERDALLPFSGDEPPEGDSRPAGSDGRKK